MAIDRDNALLDITGTYINRKFQEQSWFRENANTITTAAGFVATMLTWLSSQQFAQTSEWQAGIFIGGFLLTCVGVKFTKNGISKSQIADFNAERNQYIQDNPVVFDEATAGSLHSQRLAEFDS